MGLHPADPLAFHSFCGSTFPAAASRSSCSRACLPHNGFPRWIIVGLFRQPFAAQLCGRGGSCSIDGRQLRRCKRRLRNQTASGTSSPVSRMTRSSLARSPRSVMMRKQPTNALTTMRAKMRLCDPDNGNIPTEKHFLSPVRNATPSYRMIKIGAWRSVCFPPIADIEGLATGYACPEHRAISPH